MKRSAKLGLWAALAFTVILLPAAAAAATYIVDVKDCVLCGGGFVPRNLTIQVGDTVEWHNAGGGAKHDVTANDGSFKSPTASSFTFSHTFNSAGIVGYHCSVVVIPILGVHRGIIRVQANITPADLELQSLDAASGFYNFSDSIPVNINIKNFGSAASGDFPMRFYASTDSTITTDDVELASTTRASLAAGQSSAFIFNVPANLNDGSYFIGAIIEVFDANNANNTGVDLTAVEITPFQFNVAFSRRTTRGISSTPIPSMTVPLSTSSASIPTSTRTTAGFVRLPYV